MYENKQTYLDFGPKIHEPRRTTIEICAEKVAKKKHLSHVLVAHFWNPNQSQMATKHSEGDFETFFVGLFRNTF